MSGGPVGGGPVVGGGVLVITGTGTEVGKTVVSAAVAAVGLAAGLRVAVLKPAQTGVADGEPGDVAEIARLVGEGPGGGPGDGPAGVDGPSGRLTTAELARYPEPLAPGTAARRSGRAPVTVPAIVAAVGGLAGWHDLVLVEGAGGLLVDLDGAGGTLADVAGALGAPVLLVVAAGLGTLNVTALTAEALRHRGIHLAGLVIGSWPAEPGLADRCNLDDLPVAAGAPLLGAVPEGAARLDPVAFRAAARTALGGAGLFGAGGVRAGVAGAGVAGARSPGAGLSGPVPLDTGSAAG